MNVNKKFDRLKQWGRERMGGGIATSSTDEFKALQLEMDLRHQGMDRLQQSASSYIKSLSRRDQGEGKEKQLAVAHFGSTMVAHGDDFAADSEFGQCLLALGRANERIGRVQETYAANATSSWLESVERSVLQMKDYDAAKKKLEQRRLAFDTASGKLQKAKKEDYKMEEELRLQRQKYEESSEDVFRRMLDVKEAETDSVADITSFLEAELQYYERCREVLLQLKRDWPASPMVDSTRSSSPASSMLLRRNNNDQQRSRTNSNVDRMSRIMSDDYGNPPEAPLRPTISSTARNTASGTNSPRRELPGFDLQLPHRPTISRNAASFEGPTTLSSSRDFTPPSPAVQQHRPALPHMPTDPSQLYGARNGLRAASGRGAYDHRNGDVFGDDTYSDYGSESPDEERRRPSWSVQGHDGSSVGGGTRKLAPPPPVNRAKKPPPPPPPMKRSALSTSEIPRY